MNRKITDILKDRRKTFLFVFLAIILVLATWYKLKIQGITMTDDASYKEVLVCNNADVNHVHSADCYEKIAVTNSSNQENATQQENQNTSKQDTAQKDLNESKQQEDTNKENDNLENQNLQKNETDNNKSDENVESIDNNSISNSLKISTMSLNNLEPSTSNNAVNLYVNIDGNWTLIGILSKTSAYYGSKTVNMTDVTKIFSDQLGLNINTSDINLCYFVGGSSTFSVASSYYNQYYFDNSNSYLDVYVTANVTANRQTNKNTSDFINQNNRLKIYSITEKSEDNVEIAGSPKYVYTVSQNGVATYQLSDDYNYYVDDSTEIVKAGTQINVTKATTLKQVQIEKCTITIIKADGTTTTNKVNKGSKYKLGTNLKWKVGNSTELTDGGTEIEVNDNMTITESNEIKIKYTVDTSKSATGLDDKYKYDGIAIPTVHDSNEYTVTVEYDNGTTIENISSKYVTPYDSNATTTKDRIVLEFAGWKVNNSTTILNEQTELNWEQLYEYAQNGEINLNTAWNGKTNNKEYVNFYMRYDSVAVDTDGNITGQDANKYTPSLWASYVGNSNLASSIADTTSDNSYGANRSIRNLEGVKEDQAYIYNLPSDEYILSQLKNYSSNLSIDGEKISVDQLDLEHYEIRWYVFKSQSDCWHIDGKLVRKEGKMTVSKTFTGSKSAIETVTKYSFDTKKSSNSNFYIEMKGGNTSSTTNNLYLNSANLEDKSKEQDGVTTYELKYTWEVNVKYGINYTLTEKNYNVDRFITNTSYNINDPESTKYKKVYNSDGSYYYETDADGNFIVTYANQSKGSTNSDVANVIGVNNYAIDSGETIDTSKIINVNFTNIYAPTSAITIKKDDSATNNGLANAQFSLYEVNNGNIDKNSPIKFTYNESIYSYDESGDKTVLISPSGGSIIIDNLPTGKTYKLVEISVPDGYDVNSSVEITLTTQNNGVIVPVISKGNGKNYDDKNKILEVDNASKLTEISIKKSWLNVPEQYIKDVVVELYLNNVPISNYNLKYDLNGDGKIDEKDDITIQKRITLNKDNNWQNVWKNLPLYVDGKKAVYSVREVKIGDIKAATDGKYDSENGTWESYDAYTQYRAHTTKQQETLDQNGNVKQLSIELVNALHLVKIDVNKTSPLGKPIEGVKFRLQKIDDQGNIDSEFEAKELTTSNDGKLSFTDLEYNTNYVLTEIEGNKNYYLDSTPIYLKINKGEQGKDDTLILYKDNKFEQEAEENDYEYVSLNDTKNVLNVINISHTPMPKAGGCGVYVFYILGIFLMGCSAIIIYLRKNNI